MGIKIVPKSLFCLYCFKSETSIRHEFVTISLRREGVIDCCDLSFFQLSLLGKEGGGNLKYA